MSARLTIGLTGGIGSGKSSVAREFEALGVEVIDADALAHGLTAPGGGAIEAIRAAFGPEAIDPGGALDRARMRGIVFADPGARKRLEAELRGLRESQKLPWVEVDGRRACALVAEALVLHERLGTVPPPEFARWKRLFAAASAATPQLRGDLQPKQGEAQPKASRLQGEAQPQASRADTGEKRPADMLSPVAETLLEDSATLLDLPELMGWFIDPGRVQHEALALLQVRESRLVVSEQVKAEREASIVDGVVEAQLPDAARRRWAARLREMAEIFRMTGRLEPAALAEQTAGALADVGRPATSIPFARALAARGIEMASEVALGRTRLADVSRAPARRARS